MKKIAVLALVLVLCLAAVGIGYAKWTQTLTITGTADTADFGVRFVDTSGTWVYNVDGEIWITDNETDSHGGDLVAHASAVIDPNDETTATVVWDNLFPIECQPICADVVWQYYGTIPGVVDNATFTWGKDTDALLADLLTYSMYKCTLVDGAWVDYGDAVAVGTQLEPGDYVHAEACFQVPENLDYRHLSASGTLTIEVSQFDDCPSSTNPNAV